MNIAVGLYLLVGWIYFSVQSYREDGRLGFILHALWGMVGVLGLTIILLFIAVVFHLLFLGTGL